MSTSHLHPSPHRDSVLSTSMSFSQNPEGEILPAQGSPAPSRSRPRGRNILSAPATYVLVGINCAVFLWMVLHGVSVTSPTTNQLIHYGATEVDLMLGGQWWRLVTAIFVHVGLIHIATNMW